MTSRINALETQPFSATLPDHQHVPFVVNSPHSGRHYFDEFLENSRLTPRKIRSSEDFLVDQLIEGAVEHGMPMLAANFPRAFLDVNREPYELDPSMFKDSLPDYANTKSVRVTSGLGTIAKIVAEGQQIYSNRLSVEEALWRIETFYKPYHQELRTLLAKTHVEFGSAVLLDCHSMPSANPAYLNEERPDFVLGDRFGSACSPTLVRLAKHILTEMGYRVVINKPYAGGFITEHYGRPESGLHALQIEINRGLYMNETTLEPNMGFNALASSMSAFFEEISTIDPVELYGTVPLAAE